MKNLKKIDLRKKSLAVSSLLDVFDQLWKQEKEGAQIDQQKTSLYMSHLMCKLENKIYKYEYKSRISMCKR